MGAGAARWGREPFPGSVRPRRASARGAPLSPPARAAARGGRRVCHRRGDPPLSRRKIQKVGTSMRRDEGAGAMPLWGTGSEMEFGLRFVQNVRGDSRV